MAYFLGFFLKPLFLGQAVAFFDMGKKPRFFQGNVKNPRGIITQKKGLLGDLSV